MSAEDMRAETAALEQAADLPALIEALLAVSRLAVVAAGQVAELDINPLIVLPEGRGAVAVDALTVLAGPAGA